MEYNFLCYNYYTLYISSVYSKELRKRGVKCNLFLFEYEIQFKNINKNAWDKVIFINELNYKAPVRTIIISALRKSRYSSTRRYYGNFGAQALSEVIKNNNDVLIVFKDNDAIFASAIEKFKQLTKRKGKVVLIEEGLALYIKEMPRKFIYRNLFLLKSFNLLFGISYFGSGQIKQGYHPAIDILVAKEIDKLDDIQKNKRVIVSQTKEIFKGICLKDFIFDLTDNNIKELKSNLNSCDYFYIGQPLAQDGICSIKEENEFLRTILGAIPSNKFIIVKPHPRENSQKYSNLCYSNKNIIVLNGLLGELPAEIVFSLMDSNPIILTPYSSAYKNIKYNFRNSKIYLLFKILNNQSLNYRLHDLTKSQDVKCIDSRDELRTIENEDTQINVNIRENVSVEYLPEIEQLISLTYNGDNNSYGNNK